MFSHDEFLNERACIHIQSHDELLQIKEYYDETGLILHDHTVNSKNWHIYPYIYANMRGIHGNKYADEFTIKIEFADWLDFVGLSEDLEESEAELSLLFV